MNCNINFDVAVIGAGASGLVTAKTALECGLRPQVFEKDDQVGGLWKPEKGFVWDSLCTNLSHRTCMFSDAPWKKTSGDFPSRKEVQEYLQDYANENRLMGHISFNTEVINISRKQDMWSVKWLKDGIECKELFKYVIVCSGIFSKPYIPDIPGIETFTGQKLHSSDYKNPSTFTNKKIAVIGSSHSGIEIVAEGSTVAEQTVHCAKRAVWVLPRYLGSEKRPLDSVFYSRAAVERSKGKSLEERNRLKNAWFQNLTKQNDISAEVAVTSNPADPAYVAISDTYIKQLEKIKIKRAEIQAIKEDTIYFADNTKATVDVLILATGYTVSLPFFKPKVCEALEFDPSNRFQPLILDKCTFNSKLPNMAFVGLYRGPFFAIMELQAWLACLIFSQVIQSLSPSEVEEGMEKERKIRDQIPQPQFPHGDYVEFADQLAQAAGVLPDFESLKNDKDQQDLYNKLWNGPLNASHYRLEGFAAKREFAIKFISEM